jgi:hypothetical protein
MTTMLLDCITRRGTYTHLQKSSNKQLVHTWMFIKHPIAVVADLTLQKIPRMHNWSCRQQTFRILNEEELRFKVIQNLEHSLHTYIRHSRSLTPRDFTRLYSVHGELVNTIEHMWIIIVYRSIICTHPVFNPATLL